MFRTSQFYQLYLAFFCIIGYAQENPIDYVDPFIGTDFFGHTYPVRPYPMLWYI